MQPTDLFSISTLIDQVHTWAVVWMPNILPWMAFFLGITLVFIIARGIIDYMEGRSGDAFEREDLEYSQMAFRDLFGHEKGGEMFQISRSMMDLTPQERRFAAPYIHQIISGKGYEKPHKRDTFAMIEKVYPKHAYEVPELDYSVNKYRAEHNLTDVSDNTNIYGKEV